MLNKNGQTWLTEETLRLIITVFCLLVLFGVLYAIYRTNTNNREIQLANASLTDIMNRINNQEEQIKVYNVKGWVLSSWSAGSLIPRQCENSIWTNCLCMCAKPGTAVKTYLVACESTGICVNNKDNFKIKGFQDVVEINKIPKVLSVDYAKKTIGEPSDLDLAKISLSNLIEDINNGRTENSHRINPVGWFLTSYPRTIPSGAGNLWNMPNYLPQVCLSAGWRKCICIFSSGNEQIKSDKFAICGKSDFKIIGTLKQGAINQENIIQIKDNLAILINKQPPTIEEKK